jgi:hypothetical protein
VEGLPPNSTTHREIRPLLSKLWRGLQGMANLLKTAIFGRLLIKLSTRKVRWNSYMRSTNYHVTHIHTGRHNYKYGDLRELEFDQVLKEETVTQVRHTPLKWQNKQRNNRNNLVRTSG